MPKPKIINAKCVKNEKDKEISEIEVNFEPSPGFSPPSIYCKIDDTMINGFIVDDSHVRCQVPDGISGEKEVKISFDSESWSDCVTTNIIASEKLPPRIKREIKENKIAKAQEKKINWKEITRTKIVIIGFVVFALMIFLDLRKGKKPRIPKALQSYPSDQVSPLPRKKRSIIHE